MNNHLRVPIQDRNTHISVIILNFATLKIKDLIIDIRDCKLYKLNV